MAQSKFQFCPRGFGRTSYHVMEALQMGRIPIQIYQSGDRPWLPYENLMKNISYSVTVEELPELLSSTLRKLSDSEIMAMEDQIEKLRDDYFSLEGAMKQIGKFMLYGSSSSKSSSDDADASELICQALPFDSGSGGERNLPCGWVFIKWLWRQQ